MNNAILKCSRLKISLVGLLFLMAVANTACRSQPVPDIPVPPENLPEVREPSYDFNGGMPREVLVSYLERAITMAEFLTVDPYCNDGEYPFKELDVALIKNTGAKFIGRSIYRWGDEAVLNDPAFWDGARSLIKIVHDEDPDVIFQACVFEAVFEEVNSIPIPGWAFEALGLPVEHRNFSMEEMQNKDGKLVDHWKRRHGSVPDITRQETQLWFMFLIGTYVDLGIEAIHLGQVALMGMADPGYHTWQSFIQKVRKYVHPRARRKYVLFDAHTPTNGMVVNGVSVLDFNSKPLRIREVPGKPLKGVLEKGYRDAIYGKSQGCISPDGWHCDALPYLVEFDNFGISNHPGSVGNDHFIWGYDEISWFYLLEDSYKKGWLRYAHDWLLKNDPNGFLQMPGARIVSRGNGKPGINCRAIASPPGYPYGMDIETTIRDIWQGDN